MRFLIGKLCEQLQLMQLPTANDFIFSSRYRVWRHILYWSFNIRIWAAFWVYMEIPIHYESQLLYLYLWTPAFI